MSSLSIRVSDSREGREASRGREKGENEEKEKTQKRQISRCRPRKQERAARTWIVTPRVSVGRVLTRIGVVPRSDSAEKRKLTNRKSVQFSTTFEQSHLEIDDSLGLKT